MKRYFFYYSYLGTRFSGLQIQCGNPEIRTVQGLVEEAIEQLDPLNKVRIHTSSRTDKGVHAIRSSFHIDLEFLHPRCTPQLIVYKLNRFFEDKKAAIRIQSGQLVPDTFSSRYHALSRTYLYRLAVRKPSAPPVNESRKYLCQVPIEEWRRCHFIHYPKFSIENVKGALPLFEGVKDFKTYSAPKVDRKPPPPTVRKLHKFELTPGRSLINEAYSHYSCDYDFWDFTCQAKSFLYKQIRKMVGALIGVGMGLITNEDIESMFDNPAHESWKKVLETAPPYGLYLVDVEYNPQDMSLQDEDTSTVIHPLSQDSSS